MYEIEFYEDKNGKSEILDFIKELNLKSATNKECRINFNKIVAYLDILEELGTTNSLCQLKCVMSNNL